MGDQPEWPERFCCPPLARNRSVGFALANDGHDTRAIHNYLGHRSIASTVRYTALAPDRFKHFWRD
jgi:type 1 fimbriae regulatory protein FimE